MSVKKSPAKKVAAEKTSASLEDIRKAVRDRSPRTDSMHGNFKVFPYKDTDIGVACGKGNRVVFRLFDVCRVLKLDSNWFAGRSSPIGLYSGRCGYVDKSDLIESIEWRTLREEYDGLLSRDYCVEFVTETGLRHLLAAASMWGYDELANEFETWVYDTLIPNARRALRIDPHPKSPESLLLQRHDAIGISAQLGTFIEYAKDIREKLAHVATTTQTKTKETKNV
jgi:prophage antirepressor-like protein